MYDLMGMGHDYCGGGFPRIEAVLGYGRSIDLEIINDIFDVDQMDASNFLNGKIDIQSLFDDLANQSKYLISINTYNESYGSILLLPAVLPWELNQSIIGITKKEVRQEIIRLVGPYVIISDKELSQYIYPRVLG